MHARVRNTRLILTVPLVLIVFGCGRESHKYVPPPPPPVTIEHPVRKKVTDYVEETGTTAALQSVEIRARVEGWLDKIAFKPDQRVKKDELLFSIDPRAFQAKVLEAESELKSKQADYKLAVIEWQKAKDLYAQAAISELKYDQATAQRDKAKGAVGIAEANVQTAKLNLDYTQVKAPIDGRVSRNLVDVGNLVGAGEKTLLTTMVNDESIYVYFNLSERRYLPLMRELIQARKESSSESKSKSVRHPAILGLADEEGYPHKGYIDFANTQVDPGTGTIQVRAVFPNPDGLILQGMYARVRVPVLEHDALLIPEVAVQTDQSGTSVFTVDDKNVVARRQIETGQTVELMRVVTKGLQEKDRVIVDGLLRARPGSKVTPTRSKGSDSSSDKPSNSKK